MEYLAPKLINFGAFSWVYLGGRDYPQYVEK